MQGFQKGYIMSKINVIRNKYYHLEALTGRDFELIKSIPLDTPLVFDFKKIRNPDFHRKGFALFNLGFQNTKEPITSLTSYRKFALKEAGHVDIIPTSKGDLVLPKSLAFDKMDETEFKEVYNDVLNFVIRDIGATEEDIQNNLMSFLF